MLNQHVDILPTYSPDGATCVLVITGLERLPLTKQDIADCLREYASFLEMNPDSKN